MAEIKKELWGLYSNNHPPGAHRSGYNVAIFETRAEAVEEAGIRLDKSAKVGRLDDSFILCRVVSQEVIRGEFKRVVKREKL